MYVVYNGAREKTHSVITLSFVCSLWWSKRKNLLCYNIIFCIFSMMEQDKKTDSVITLFFVSCLWWSKRKKLIPLSHYFLYVVYDGAREKTYSLITMIFVWYLWWSKRKNSFRYNIIVCMLSMMEQEKKLIRLSNYFLQIVYDGEREKTIFKKLYLL